MRLVWDRSAWEDYRHWQTADRKVVKRINTLIDACLREPFAGIGKPEQLKYGAQGGWSRRITDEHGFVYKIVGDDVRVAACRHHYAR